MSKIFETEMDINNEERALKLFMSISKKKVYAIKLPTFELDYLIHNGREIICFLEIKCFKSNWPDYPCKIISMAKMEKMKKFSSIAPTYIAFLHLDGVLAYINCWEAKGEIKISGRTDNRDGATNDIEKLMFVPTELFKVFTK